MNTKTKKIIKKIFKIIWIILGGFLTIIFLLAFIKMKTFSGSGMSGIGGAIGVALLFMITGGMFIIYIGTTILFLFIRWLIKRLKKKKIISHEHKFSGKIKKTIGGIRNLGS
ncbi:MAG: hypothetical protein PHQ66_01555 [Candidatus Nanoarchaeia archaeon]|nr:hypothetical protein [Candidatus Nanoarchaeia archaeon]MDD5357938.1 hypothetical protein [Candidatus Nanoarchaeia archaeon]MDD5588857.1 hypothetical protein [Candidatus Nanoarchaeia archaeon]